MYPQKVKLAILTYLQSKSCDDILAPLDQLTDKNNSSVQQQWALMVNIFQKAIKIKDMPISTHYKSWAVPEQ